MERIKQKHVRRSRRRKGIRKRVVGTPGRPRLSVFRSNRHISAQVIDDLAGRTLAAATTHSKQRAEPAGNCTAAAAIGSAVAEMARKAGVKTVVFDRSGYRYHGRVKALADAAREGGLKF